jgi:hypothetical protein
MNVEETAPAELNLATVTPGVFFSETKRKVGERKVKKLVVSSTLL